MSKHNAVGVQLQERLDRLVRRVGTIEGDLRSAGDRDWQERASEVENDDVLEGLDDITRAEIRQIREALSRIESGSYGTCSDCGQPIGAARLTAIPTAVTCVACTTRRSLAPTGR
jgi:RNA polymerase-binding transcription factor